MRTVWRTLGARGVLQEIGRAWLDSARTAVLSVPSAVLVRQMATPR